MTPSQPQTGSNVSDKSITSQVGSYSWQDSCFLHEKKRIDDAVIVNNRYFINQLIFTKVNLLSPSSNESSNTSVSLDKLYILDKNLPS